MPDRDAVSTSAENPVDCACTSADFAVECPCHGESPVSSAPRKDSSASGCSRPDHERAKDDSAA